MFIWANSLIVKINHRSFMFTIIIFQKYYQNLKPSLSVISTILFENHKKYKYDVSKIRFILRNYNNNKINGCTKNKQKNKRNNSNKI